MSSGKLIEYGCDDYSSGETRDISLSGKLLFNSENQTFTIDYHREVSPGSDTKINAEGKYTCQQANEAKEDVISLQFDKLNKNGDDYLERCFKSIMVRGKLGDKQLIAIQMKEDPKQKRYGYNISPYGLENPFSAIYSSEITWSLKQES